MDDHEKAIEAAARALSWTFRREPNDRDRVDAEAAVKAYLAARAEGENPAKLCPREPTVEQQHAALEAAAQGPQNEMNRLIGVMHAAWDAAPEPGHD